LIDGQGAGADGAGTGEGSGDGPNGQVPERAGDGARSAVRRGRVGARRRCKLVRLREL